MLHSLDRLAAAVSTRLVAWTCARVSASHQEWASALAAEHESIEGGCHKLAWALGAVPLAWSLQVPRESNEISVRGTRVTGQPNYTARAAAESFALNLLTLLVWWLGFGLLLRSLYPHGIPTLHAGEISIFAGCAVGTFLAFAIRRSGAAYVLAGFSVMLAIEFMFHSRFGGAVVQGGPAQFGAMGAAIGAVSLSALIERGAGASTGTLAVAMRPAMAARNKFGRSAHLLLGLLMFAATEVFVRAFYAAFDQRYIVGMSWIRVFRDSQTNYAILLCALVGAAVGAALGRWGHHLALPRPRSEARA